jgi:hypothetical protein
MSPFQVLSPLTDFVTLISMYFAEIWDFLIFIGGASGIIIVLVGAILWFTEANMKRGKGLVFAGILLSIIIQYFVMYPPAFVVT